MIYTACLQSNADYALAYAAKGWAVFPASRSIAAKCYRDHSDSMRLDLQKQHIRPATDQDRVRRYWAHSPSANIGVQLGAASKLLVVRLTGDLGLSNWFEMSASSETAVDTATVDTPFGWDLYFECKPEDADLCGPIAPGVTLLGNGAYALLPPSRSCTGEFFTWNDPDQRVLELPAWLLNRLLTSPEEQFVS
jgi:Bifunctional DNA primase/polymerase, N-terminal